MDRGWQSQPAGITASSGVIFEPFTFQPGMQHAASSKFSNENSSQLYGSQLQKSKAPAGQENSVSLSVSQAHSRQQDKARRPFADIGRSYPSASREQSSGSLPIIQQDRSYTTGTLPLLPQQNWTDIDELNKENIIACSGYASAIFDHLKQTQKSYHPNPFYLQEVQHDVNPHMRAVLADWLIEVSEEYKLCSDTLWLTFNYLDRFLSKAPVSRGKLQLAGVAAMWIAAKYEEIYAPNAAQFCYITDNTYSKEQLVVMEEQLLAALEFRLTAPTVKTFLRRFLQACVADEKLHYLASYIAELSLLDHQMLQFFPDEVAASAVYLARCMLRSKSWNPTLEHYSGFRPGQLQSCASLLLELHQKAYARDDLTAIKEKYGTHKFQEVSGIAPLPYLPIPRY